jgi:hypothetical protein
MKRKALKFRGMNPELGFLYDSEESSEVKGVARKVDDLGDSFFSNPPSMDRETYLEKVKEIESLRPRFPSNKDHSGLLLVLFPADVRAQRQLQKISSQSEYRNRAANHKQELARRDKLENIPRISPVLGRKELSHDFLSDLSDFVNDQFQPPFKGWGR